MKFVFLFFLQLQVILYFSVVDGFDKHSNHKSHKKYHHQTKSKVTMPSGNSYLIATPSAYHKWKCGDKPTLITLHPKNRAWRKEYTIVKRELENTKGHAISYKHLKIQKVINPCIWKKYQYRKGQVHFEAKKTNERMFFHADAHPMTVVDKGFDERYAKLTDAYGAGFIFDENSFKSHSFAKMWKDKTRVMLLCRVTLGNTFTATTKQKLPHAPVGFQSVSGTDGGFKQYVVYRGEQVYPEYIITYKTV